MWSIDKMLFLTILPPWPVCWLRCALCQDFSQVMRKCVLDFQYLLPICIWFLCIDTLPKWATWFQHCLAMQNLGWTLNLVLLFLGLNLPLTISDHITQNTTEKTVCYILSHLFHMYVCIYAYLCHELHKILLSGGLNGIN